MRILNSPNGVTYFDCRSYDDHQISALTGTLSRCTQTSTTNNHIGSFVVVFNNSKETRNAVPIIITQADGQAWIVLLDQIYNQNELQNNSITQPTSADHYDGVMRCILEGFIEKGEIFLSQLYGSFIVLIYIKSQDRLILCRDPIGGRSLYFPPLAIQCLFR